MRTVIISFSNPATLDSHLLLPVEVLHPQPNPALENVSPWYRNAGGRVHGLVLGLGSGYRWHLRLPSHLIHSELMLRVRWYFGGHSPARVLGSGPGKEIVVSQLSSQNENPAPTQTRNDVRSESISATCISDYLNFRSFYMCVGVTQSPTSIMRLFIGLIRVVRENKLRF